MNCRWALAGEHQVGIAVIFKDRHVVLFCQRQHFPAPFNRHDSAGRVLDGGDGIDVFRFAARRSQVRQRAFQRIHAHAVMIKLDPDILDTQRIQPAQRTGIVCRLQQDDVALAQQRLVDQVHGLKRSGGQQNLLRLYGHRIASLQAVANKFA